MWKLKGYTVDAFDQTQVVYNIWANTKNDLPSTMTDIGYGTALGFGSTAQTFDDSKEWRWNGTDWVEQTTGQEIEISADDIVYDNTDSGLTATNVQDAIDEIHTTDETQDNALVELYGENANQQLEINYAINTGAKNLFKIRDPFTNTRNNVTFVVNSDGTVDVSTTSDGASAQTDLTIGTVYTYEGVTYKLTGCPSGVTGLCACGTGGTGSVIDTGSGALLTPTADGSRSPFVRVYNGAVITTPVKFYPMIRLAEIKNNTFEPYAPTNRELYETVQTKADKGSFDITVAGSPLVTSEYSYSCMVTGDIATVCIRLILADVLDVNTSRNLFKIPVGYRPPQAVAGTGYADGKVRVFWINTSGDVKIRIDEAIPSGATINVNFCYSYNSANWTTVTANQLQSLNSPLTLNLGRNDLNESLDSNFDLIDSIPEEEEGELE